MTKFVWLLIFFQATSSPVKHSPNVSFTATFIRAVDNLLDLGDSLFSKLEKAQALNSVQEVITGANGLEDTKRQLKNDILQAEDDRSLEHTRRARFQKIETDIMIYHNDLVKFATEIDSTSKPAAEDIRATAQSLLSTRENYMRNAEHIVEQGGTDWKIRAAAQIDKALVCDKEIIVAASCLKDSIGLKRRDSRKECSEESIEADTLKCTNAENALFATPTSPRPPQ